MKGRQYVETNCQEENAILTKLYEKNTINPLIENLDKEKAQMQMKILHKIGLEFAKDKCMEVFGNVDDYEEKKEEYAEKLKKKYKQQQADQLNQFCTVM